jgi:hypothetical protein
MLFGTLLARGVPFSRDEILKQIYDEDHFKTHIDIDNCISLFADHDNATKMKAGVAVPRMPKFIVELFKNKTPTLFIKLWKRYFSEQKLYTEKDLEPYVKKFEEAVDPGPDIVEGIAEESGVLIQIISQRLLRFLEFCKDHGKEFFVSSSNILIGRKMKLWEFEFIFDLGRNFYLNAFEFYSLTHFFVGEASKGDYRLPNLDDLMEMLEIENTYKDCYPIDRVLSVADYLARLTGCVTGERLFEKSNPPLVGIMSRFPDELVKTNRKPTTCDVYTNEHGERIYVNGSVLFAENDRKDLPPYILFTRVAHSFISVVEKFDSTKIQLCSGGASDIPQRNIFIKKKTKAIGKRTPGLRGNGM